MIIHIYIKKIEINILRYNKKIILFLNKMIKAILGLIGFGAKGIIKGSLAALYQSSIVVVKAGSLFAKLTSMAMRS